MSYGLTLQGLVVKTLTDIKAEREASYKELFGQSIDLDPQGPFGQVISIESEREAVFWETLQQVYDAFDADNASGLALDILCALTGTIRRQATRSTVTGHASGTNGTLLPAGRVISVAGTGVKFRTLADATIGVSGVDVLCESVDTGPKVADAGTLTVIETAVGGWTDFTNVLDATFGQNRESDTELRGRREIELRKAGSGSADAIRAHLLEEVDGVTAVAVFENPTDSTDVDGLPPHSFEVLVSGGADQDILNVIFTNKPAGIQTYGDVTGTVIDSQGVSRSVKFSRPTEIDIYVVANLVIDAAKWPATGVQQIKDALVAYGPTVYVNGKNVVAGGLEAQTFKVSGVLDSTCLIGTSPGPVSRATVTITTRQFAKLDTSRITVNATPGTP
jgi:uncharacterized phage protein gp47/JayE